MYLIRDQFEISYFRNAYFWYFFVAMVNLVTIFCIVYFYNTRNNTLIGPKGPRGKRGKRGKEGKFVSCGYCKTNLYILKQPQTDIIATLDNIVVQTDEYNVKYFDNLIRSGAIDYSQFVNKIILAKTGDPSASEAVARFQSLMNPAIIATQVLNRINITKGKGKKGAIAEFKRPIATTGYARMGDAVVGGAEGFDLNGFLINGDIMYPQSYDLLVSFRNYNADTGEYDTFSIWRPVGQSTMELQQVTATSNTNVTVQYEALGDVCSVGTTAPTPNMSATIRNTCLEEVSPEYATFIFAYAGNQLQFTDESAQSVDYKQPTSYLIENKVSSNIDLFSIWRTPLNTFITNSNRNNVLTNNTVGLNMYNNMDYALNEYGNLKTEAKIALTNYLATVTIDKIMVAAILCKHFEILYARELIYYINKSQIAMGVNLKSISLSTTGAKTSTIPTPTQLDLSTLNLDTDTKLGDMMAGITTTIAQIEKYNANLTPLPDSVTVPTYQGNANPSTPKQLPTELMNVYNRINAQLATLPIQIENCENFLDLVNTIFDNGLDTRIAVDSDGLTEGGILMTEMQELVIRIGKILMPPAQPIYMIKDECLAASPLDKSRLELVRQFTEIVGEHNKYIAMKTDDTVAYNNMQTVLRQQELILNNELGTIVGHIDGWYDKLQRQQLDEFTDSRIKSMIAIYKKTNEFYAATFAAVNAG